MRAARAAIVLSAAILTGCGEDDNVDFPAQVIYRVSAVRGTTTFRMAELRTGGSVHVLPAGSREFTVDSAAVTFVLANSPPPYRGIFEFVSGDGEVTIEAREVQGTEAETTTLSAAEPIATVDLRPNAGMLAAAQVGLEVRFEVCSPIDPKATDCSDTVVGRRFDGTIGDSDTSNTLAPVDSTAPEEIITTPAILFLERPQDTVSGIFRGHGEQLLHARLFIDDDLIESGTDDGDVVLSEDI